MTIIRGTSTLAFIMLHLILSIGPLARLDSRFLPILYNRRHLGVCFFFIAFIHSAFSIFYFHALGDANPIVSVFTSNEHYGSISRFPFQILGFIAIVIFFFMAVTSHDFWLEKLSPMLWKTLHMLVYLAYVLVVGHVALGIMQVDHPYFWKILLTLSVAWICGVHLLAGIKMKQKDSRKTQLKGKDPWTPICSVQDIPKDRAKIFVVNGEEVAVFKSNNKLYALNNYCRHQGGPLGEGKIVEGCVTCPWHGYQYQADNGQSPPPFKEKVKKYRIELRGDTIYIDGSPLPPGTFVEPVEISAS